MGCKKYKGAIFDQDGLLFDTEKIYQSCWLAAAKKYGIDMDSSFPRLFCGRPTKAIAGIVAAEYPGLDVDGYCRLAIGESWRKQLESVPEKKQGLGEMLAFCRENGIRTAVASSSTLEVIEHNLSSAGIRDSFDAVVSGEEVGKGKPAPDIFLLAARKIGVDPALCCVFEDAESGILGAVAAGCRAVMIPDSSPPPELPDADFMVFRDLKEACKAFSF